MEPLALRALVYAHFAETGEAPSRARLIDAVGGEEATDVVLAQLHASHMVVLDDRPGRYGEIRMALPFSAEPTGYGVIAGDRSWWANCAWDSLAVIAATHVDARIEATWADTGESLTLDVAGGELGPTEGFVHFEVPARHWWDDIVFT